MTVPDEEATANYVPAAAVIRRWQALSGIIGRKGSAGRHYWNDSNDVRQGFYGILNGKLSAVKRNLTVDLWIKNAASKEYIAYFFQTSGK